MTTLTEEQLDKLPKYVSDEIERLDRSIRYWKAKVEVGPADSDTFIEHYGGIDGPVTPLGRGTTVAFYRRDRTRDSVDGWQHRFDVSIDDEGELRISGGDGLLVRPYAGNAIRVRHGR